MVINIPQHLKFPQSLSQRIFDRTSKSVGEWEISVPRKNDLAWSIVLPYLMSTNYYRDQNYTDLKRRLRALTDDDKTAELVNKSIRHFNPFRNRHAPFFDEALKYVVNEFSERLNFDSLLNVSDKLTAASEALKCSIVLIRCRKETENIQFFPKVIQKRQDLITLVASTSTENVEEKNFSPVYNFMISYDLGLKMKAAALLYFLRETKVSKNETKQLKSLIDKGDNFLISILKSNYQNVILKLYSSPYVVSKLIEAGYEMDPRLEDSEGFSALGHALLTENPSVFYKLYYFAANNCCISEGSYRNPDSGIVSNLLCMEKILSSNLEKLKESCDVQLYNELKVKHSEIQRLNRFLIEVNSEILKVKSKLNYYESTEENVFEANKRRDVIVILLDTYEKFFKFAELNVLSLSPLDDYILHKNYYGLIDMATALIFFDNIILLKERLKLEKENQFSDIETSFFFSILYHIAFEKIDFRNYLKKMNYLNYSFYNYKSIGLFPLLRRQDNLENIKYFNHILHDIVINNDNVVKYVPQKEIDSVLHSQPVFKCSLEFSRLHQSIQTSLKSKITDVKSVLVVERALQAIGEYLASDKKDKLEKDILSSDREDEVTHGSDYFFLKRFLHLSLPKEVSQILRRLRHELTHLKGYAFPSKFECESNFSLFRSIQCEIRQIARHFNSVYQIMALKFIFHLVELLEKEVLRLKSVIHLYTHSDIQPFFFDENFILLIKNAPLSYFQKFVPSLPDFLKISFNNIEVELKDEYLSENIQNQNVKEHVLEILRPIKWLFVLLQQYKVDRVENLLNEFEAIENSNNITIDEMKKKTDMFLMKCYDFLPTLDTMKKKKRKSKIKSVKFIEHFLKILKGFVYLSDEEKDSIREEIPQNIRRSVAMKNKLIQSIEEGFSLNIDVNSAEFELSYLSKTKLKALKGYYTNKDTYALTILSTTDPVTELEEIFLKNCIDKKRYDSLCETFQFSEKTKKKLAKIVAGQRKKIPVNNLSNLLNRIQLLKRILIDEDEEIQNLWIKIKCSKSRQLIDDKIVRRYLKDRKLQAAVEMLLFDCMMLFENEKLSENPWLKKSRLYSGINLRNVISHGSPLLEALCKIIDPQDLPSEFIKMMLSLIKGEDAVKAILELYDVVNQDYVKLLQTIDLKERDEYSELRDRIQNCDEWRNYVLLLPYKKAFVKN